MVDLDLQMQMRIETPTFGQHLCSLRLARGMSRMQLARLSGGCP